MADSREEFDAWAASRAGTTFTGTVTAKSAPFYFTIWQAAWQHRDAEIAALRAEVASLTESRAGWVLEHKELQDGNAALKNRLAELRAERDSAHVDIGRRVLLERSLRAEVAKVRERCSEWALIAGEHGAEKDSLHAEVERLKQERDTFYMDYRMKCDAQTKSLHAEVERLRKDAERSVGKTAARCREMAMWPQSIDDEQAYYGSMFAEFITKEFGAAIDAAMRQEPKA